MSGRLRLRDAGGWQPAGAIPLPVAVSSAVRLAAHGADLHLWINGPDSGTTTWLKLTPQRELMALPLLAFSSAGACACGDLLLLTGSAAGEPLAAGLLPDGSRRWEHALDPGRPVNWPRPFCAAGGLLAWQVTPDLLHVAPVDAQGVGAAVAVPVGRPPLHLAADGQVVRAVWGDGDGVAGVELGAGEPRALRVAMRWPDGLALAGGLAGWHLAWQQRETLQLGRWTDAGVADAQPLDVGPASGGRLALLAGHRPVVWVQRPDDTFGEPPAWLSAIGAPGVAPLLLDGLVHAVAWWGEQLVVVGRERLYLFVA